MRNGANLFRAACALVGLLTALVPASALAQVAIPPSIGVMQHLPPAPPSITSGSLRGGRPAIPPASCCSGSPRTPIGPGYLKGRDGHHHGRYVYPGLYYGGYFYDPTLYSDNYDENDDTRAVQQPAPSQPPVIVIEHHDAPVAQPAVAQPAPQPQPVESAASNEPEAVLVYRDGRRQEIGNYAIMGNTVYVFSPRAKVPLADLDIPATQSANDDRGIDFRLPSSSSAQ